MIYDKLYIIAGSVDEAYDYAKRHGINRRDIVYINTPEMLRGLRNFIVTCIVGWEGHRNANAIEHAVSHLIYCDYATKVYADSYKKVIRLASNGRMIKTTLFSIGDNVQHDIVPKEMFIVD